MSSRAKRKVASSVPSVWELAVARLLLAVAIGVSIYLAWISFSGKAAAGCGPDSDCQQVLHSRWAYWLGVPVSLLGIATYIGLFLSTFWFSDLREAARRKARMAGLFFLLLCLGGVLWFFLVQWMVLKRFCPFCLAAHASAGVAAVLLLTHLSPATSRSPAVPSGKWRRQALAAATGLMAALVLGQVLFPKKEFQVRPVDASAVTPKPAAVPAPRMLEIHGGKFRLPVNAYPVIGSTNATHLLLSLFDYTCHHCRESHHLFDQALARHGNQIAFISIPMPLDSRCNRLVKKTPKTHDNACDYARLGLAVWKAKPAAFAEFTSWIFTPPTPPPVEEAQLKAAQLVGPDNLRLEDGWLDATVQLSINIFEANSPTAADRKMPQLIMGKSIVAGPIHSLAEFEQMLQTNLSNWKPTTW